MSSRSRFQVALFSLSVLSFLLGSLVSTAEPNRVEWAQLPDRVSDQLLDLSELDLFECSEEVAARRPAREVLQVIENVFYKWQEHDRPNELGENTVCLVMSKPVPGALSVEEAQVLLTASSLWTRRSIQVRPLQLPPDHSLFGGEPAIAPAPWAKEQAGDSDGPDRGVGIELDNRPPPGESTPPSVEETPESVIGSDERTRVGASSAQAFPWNTIAYVSTTFPNGAAFRATAFLIGPYAALTNGHVIYNASRGGFVASLSLAPGQTQVFQGGFVTQPFGSKPASSVETNTSYTSTGESQYDYAGILYDSMFPIGTYMPLVFDEVLNSTHSVNIAGFPKEAQGDTNSEGMWHGFNSVRQTNGRVLEHYVDTSGGNSGGPVWQFFSGSNSRRVVALHSFGAVSYNGGPRLVQQNRNLIESWMNYTPTGGPSSCVADDDTLCLNSGRFRVEVDWYDGSSTGTGQVVPGGSDDSANLWFFRSTNWEMLIKVLNACAVNNRYWVFFAATTDVQFTVTVTDTHNGTQSFYTNPLGQPANAITDTNAFATCP